MFAVLGDSKSRAYVRVGLMGKEEDEGTKRCARSIDDVVMVVLANESWAQWW